MTDNGKKKIKLGRGLSKDKVRAMAGETLTDGGLPVPKDPLPSAIPSPGNRKPGSIMKDFNDAAADMTQPMLPSAMPRPAMPRAPSP